MTQIYIYNLVGESLNSPYQTTFLATNLANGDLLSVVEGDLQQFLADNPDFKEYYGADWYQNYYPDSPGDTPLEKYLNAINGVTMDNPPKWNNILPALVRSSFFAKMLTTRNANAFSALQTTVQYRSMDLFKFLAKETVAAIPDGLTQQQCEELNAILLANNFPSLTEIMQ
jgi:hypothetical protein